MKQHLKHLGQRLLPKSSRLWLLRHTRWPPVGRIRWGQLRRLMPISRAWGADRGQAVDRHYLEIFLAAHGGDIRGRVLEVGHDTYTRRFGGDRVERAEVVHGEPGNPRADHMADFAAAPQLPTAAFDCVICTQTLQFIPHLEASLETLHRILVPGGTLLVTVPGISQIDPAEEGGWVDHWRFTSASLRWLLERHFEPAAVEVESWGNVLAATAFLHGIAREELSPQELEYRDPRYEVLIAARAVKGKEP